MLSNCIAGDIMIEQSLAKLIEACQSQHKLCSKCCSSACGKSHCTRARAGLYSRRRSRLWDDTGIDAVMEKNNKHVPPDILCSGAQY